MLEPNVESGLMSWEDLIGESNTLEVETPETEEVVEETPEVVETETIETELEFETEDLTVEEPVKEVEDKKVNTELKSSDSPYIHLAKKYIELGKWDDAVIETEEGEVKLSEIEELDEDTFFQIQEEQERLKEEERSQKYIPKDGLNETSLKLIELQKSGGDISEAFQVYNEFVSPLEGLNLNDERVQEHLVAQSLKSKINDPEIIQMTIEKYKRDLVLDKKAQEVVDFTNAAWDKYLEQRTTEAQNKKQQEAEAHKAYLKSLEEQYKDVDLKPAKKKEILQLASKDEKGELQAINAVRELLKDPAKAKEALFFLSDMEAYKKSIGAQVKIKNNIETAKKISIVKDKQRKQGTSKKEEKDVADFDFIPIN